MYPNIRASNDRYKYTFVRVYISICISIGLESPYYSCKDPVSDDCPRWSLIFQWDLVATSPSLEMFGVTAGGWIFLQCQVAGDTPSWPYCLVRPAYGGHRWGKKDRFFCHRNLFKGGWNVRIVPEKSVEVIYIYTVYIHTFFWGAFHVSELQGVYKVGVCDPSLPTRSIRVSYVSCLFQRTLAWTSEGQQRRCLCGCGSKILETRDEGYRILTNPFLTPLSYTQLFSFFLFGWVVGSPNALDLLGCRCFLRYGFSWRVGHAPVPP
jgi:hypothetical protein